MRNCRFSVFRTSYREYHLLPVWCILSLPPSRLARAQHCLNHQPFHWLWSGLSVASCVQPCFTGAWGVCELWTVNMDTHMEKNGAWDASVLCLSYISTEGLLKSGWLLVTIVYRWRGGGGGGICENIMLDSFHSPLSDNDWWHLVSPCLSLSWYSWWWGWG